MFLGSDILYNFNFYNEAKQPSIYFLFFATKYFYVQWYLDLKSQLFCLDKSIKSKIHPTVSVLSDPNHTLLHFLSHYSDLLLTQQIFFSLANQEVLDAKRIEQYGGLQGCVKTAIYGLLTWILNFDTLLFLQPKEA